MNWKQIWQQPNYCLYDIKGGKSSKSSIGFIEFQENVRKAFAVHTQITWAYLDDDKETAIELLNELKQFTESC